MDLGDIDVVRTDAGHLVGFVTAATTWMMNHRQKAGKNSLLNKSLIQIKWNDWIFPARALI